jgi:hypothetical protein
MKRHLLGQDPATWSPSGRGKKIKFTNVIGIGRKRRGWFHAQKINKMARCSRIGKSGSHDYELKSVKGRGRRKRRVKGRGIVSWLTSGLTKKLIGDTAGTAVGEALGHTAGDVAGSVASEGVKTGIGSAIKGALGKLFGKIGTSGKTASLLGGSLLGGYLSSGLSKREDHVHIHHEGRGVRHTSGKGNVMLNNSTTGVRSRINERKGGNLMHIGRMRRRMY